MPHTRYFLGDTGDYKLESFPASYWLRVLPALWLVAILTSVFESWPHKILAFICALGTLWGLIIFTGFLRRQYRAPRA